MAVMTDEFINNSLAAAAGMAMFFVGVPQAEMMEALHLVRANLEMELAEAFGADIAALVAQAFVAAVIAGRREIESAGGAGRVLN